MKHILWNWHEGNNLHNTVSFGTFHGCASLESFTFPDGTTSIPSFFFSECSSLSSVVIPNSVTSIGKYAFQACSSLKSVTLPLRLKDIDEGVFSGCSRLTSVVVLSTIRFSEKMFFDCRSLSSFKYYSGVNLVNYQHYYCFGFVQIGTEQEDSTVFAPIDGTVCLFVYLLT